jgi:bifunctional DNA-binding transcriptional regulator/antitoxin component of YhaV-PrlF toxin-antitoxin module
VFQYILHCMEKLIIHKNIEVRRVQSLQGEKSFTIVLPKEFAVQLGIGKGDFLKCLIEGKRLIVEKMQI